MIYIICHEFGHAIDFLEMSNEERQSMTETVRVFNICKNYCIDFPVEVRNFVLESEKIACEYGEQIISFIGNGYSKTKARKIRTSLMNSYSNMFN